MRTVVDYQEESQSHQKWDEEEEEEEENCDNAAVKEDAKE